MENSPKKNVSRCGRNPKANPKKYTHGFTLNENENTLFLSLVKDSGAKNKSRYITSVLLGKKIKTVSIDMAAMEYYIRLTTFYNQFRVLATSYKEATDILNLKFSREKARIVVSKLENLTIRLSEICYEIKKLTDQFEFNYLKEIKK
ncbi:plasmid mobilization protein [Elizabethkingia ursingii]|uniref:MobA protein n=1 Tax=Elizabethkingia ursingii TaxID=1756150 RepID=A0ABX3NFH0_9FLAO|nr:hypothetical protein [Elizabethkingia ursingii]OPB94561.1 hypothetical protein BB021_18340 [Elizabethkingia ursingii]